MGSVIKAIIFDCFGVLAVDSWLPFKEEHFGGKEKLVEAATKLNRQADRGEISNDEFIVEIARLAGVTTAMASRQIGQNPANRPLFNYIHENLKDRYRLGVLSNASTDWTNRLFTPEQLGLFDAIVMSYQIGFIKPDPRAYMVISQKLDLLPEQCVFVDDQDRQCEGARKAGMKAVLYHDFELFSSDIGRILSS